MNNDKNKYSAQIKHLKSNYKKFQIDIKNSDFELLQSICRKNKTTLTTEIKKFLKSYIDNNS